MIPRTHPAPGDPCGPEGQCPGGHYCTAIPGGTCEPQKDTGGPCIESYECTSNGCAGGMCQPRPGQGEPCGNLFCEDGLFCPAGVCTGGVQPGDACMEYYDCSGGLLCSAAMLCEPWLCFWL